MKRFIVAVFAILVVAPCAAHVARAQSLLERLEKRLNEAVEPTEVPKRPAEKGAPGYLGLKADVKGGGVEVVSVRAGGPADQAGIKPGDRLVSAAGVEIKDLDAMAEVVGALPAGAQVEFVVSRGGRQQKIMVELAEREPVPGNRLPPEELPREEPLPVEEVERAYLGVRASPVDAGTQRRYGLTIRSGAVIETIERDSPAARYGLPIGAAIVAIDGVRVDSPEDLADIVATTPPGATVEISFYVRDEAFRKRVRLAPAIVEAAPREAGDRPLLRKLERALDSVIEPERVPAPRAPARSLEEEVARLRERIEFLERRVEHLEVELDARRTSPEELPSADAPKPEPPLEPRIP